MLSNIHKIHFVGIGGAGMSAIAKVLLEKGYQVSGSDIAKSETVRKLELGGAKIVIGHSRDAINGAEAIVVSTAIPQTNPEVCEARDRGLPIFHRSDIVTTLMAEKAGIAVAGAHGKTTTTSMIAVVLEQCGVDPTVIIGGELDLLGGNAKYGKGDYLVAEADESDGTFLTLTPQFAVITNIENDHMDFYKSMDNILLAFEKFLLKLPQSNGVGILCFDNAHIRDIAAGLQRKYISYAVEHEAEYMAKNIRTQGMLTMYDVYHGVELLGNICLHVPGIHNVSNSLAAVVLGLQVGLPFSAIAESLVDFNGAKRRFQTKAKINNIWIVDDYAHHPTEIQTTLAAARQTNPERLICVFQPHRYTRTQFLQREFGSCFTAADILILTDIYSAGEQPIAGVNGQTLVTEVEHQTGKKAIYIQEKDSIVHYLREIAAPGDLIITMGAGNIYRTGEQLAELLAEQPKC